MERHGDGLGGGGLRSSLISSAGGGISILINSVHQIQLALLVSGRRGMRGRLKEHEGSKWTRGERAGELPGAAGKDDRKMLLT